MPLYSGQAFKCEQIALLVVVTGLFRCETCLAIALVEDYVHLTHGVVDSVKQGTIERCDPRTEIREPQKPQKTM